MTKEDQIKKLIEAIEALIKALPRESIHNDSLVKAVHNANALILKIREDQTE